MQKLSYPKHMLIQNGSYVNMNSLYFL